MTGFSNGDDRELAASVPPPVGAFCEDRLLQLNEDYAFVLVGSRAAVLHVGAGDVPASDRFRFLTISAFQDWARNMPCYVGDRLRNYGELWLSSEHRRTFQGVTFVPQPGPKKALPSQFNLWQGFEVEPDAAGDCSLYLEHLGSGPINLV